MILLFMPFFILALFAFVAFIQCAIENLAGALMFLGISGFVIGSLWLMGHAWND